MEQKAMSEKVSNAEALKKILTIILTGFRLHELSWNTTTNKYDRDEVDCMVEAAGGDKNTGYMCHLFDYWGNDVEKMAAHYGVGYGKDGNVKTDIPPVPDTESDYTWNSKIEKWVKIK